MRSSTGILLSSALLAVGLLAGCSNLGGDLVAPEPADDRGPDAAFKSLAGAVPINGYLVRFDGREFTDGQTTFSYTVLPDAGALPLERFFLEVPGDLSDPVSFEPSYGVLENFAKFGLYGVVWRVDPGAQPQDGDPPTAREDSVFTVSYAGNVPLGGVEALVGVGGAYGGGTVPGPGVGSTFAGTVFVDTDGDGVRDPATEPGLPDVIVELVAADATVDTVRTGTDGAWFAEGVVVPVTVRIDPSSSAVLDAYYEATTALEQAFQEPGDRADVDFGFQPVATEIVESIETGDLPSTGEDRLFWKRQFGRALLSWWWCPPGHAFGAVYGPHELLEFIAAIEVLAYAHPYQFRDGRELLQGFKRLARRTRTDLQKLKQELLVTELNHVAGLGLTDQTRQLQADLIAWGESIVIQETAAQAGQAAARTDAADKAGGRDLKQAIAVFEAINTGGGGIIDE